MTKNFYSAIMNGHTEKVRIAVEKDVKLANLHFTHLVSSISALSTACRFRRNAIVTLLLGNKAAVNAVDGHGKTALFYAVAHFDANASGAELLQMLLDAGADTSLLFEIPIPEKPSKDYFCFNCTGVADDGTNEPSRDLTNPNKLVVYRQKKLNVLEIAQAFKLKDAVDILEAHALKKESVPSVAHALTM
jgi:ankyrin repeat protein